MEKQKNKSSKSRSNLTFGIFLVVIGGIWLLKKLHISIRFPYINWHKIFHPFNKLLENFGDIIFSWPMFLLVIGLIMIATKKKMGPALAIVGGIFLIPIIFSIQSISSSLILPILLVAIGVTFVVNQVKENQSETEQ